MAIKNKLFSFVHVEVVVIIALTAKSDSTIQTNSIEETGSRNWIKLITFFTN